MFLTSCPFLTTTLTPETGVTLTFPLSPTHASYPDPDREGALSSLLLGGEVRGPLSPPTLTYPYGYGTGYKEIKITPL